MSLFLKIFFPKRYLEKRKNKLLRQAEHIGKNNYILNSNYDRSLLSGQNHVNLNKLINEGYSDFMKSGHSSRMYTGFYFNFLNKSMPLFITANNLDRSDCTIEITGESHGEIKFSFTRKNIVPKEETFMCNGMSFPRGSNVNITEIYNSNGSRTIISVS